MAYIVMNSQHSLEWLVIHSSGQNQPVITIKLISIQVVSVCLPKRYACFFGHVEELP